ncbi:MAG: AAA family ATPase [Magnetococcales bacterium]|nr:AAA family ATPase [Magnetococcales bacterium]
MFEKRQIDAINAALGARRPLLVRGEPGIGKSQLARAAAKVLGWAYLPFVADARTESRDLLWHFDAVARLADAQAQQGEPDGENKEQTLPIGKYLTPGVLWWAFNWQDAKDQAEKATVPIPSQHDQGSNDKGCVVLIDEIDKADSDVPNGLLEALGIGQFPVRDRNEPVRIGDKPLLVVITTNEERTLPDAFIRRCLVLHLALSTDEQEAKRHFMTVGKAHFGDAFADEMLQQAAELVAEERSKAAQRHWRPLPGQAEYLDLLRSIEAQAGKDRDRQQSLLETVAEYILAKDPAAARRWSESQK